MKTQHLLFCLLSVIVLTNVANAGDINYGKETPTSEAIIKQFSSKSPTSNVAEDADAPTDIKSGEHRMIDMGNLKSLSHNKPKPQQKPNPVAAKRNNDTHNVTASASVEIKFGYDSAELTAEAKQQLNPFGEAVASEKLQNKKFIVEGHTDAIGGDAHNIPLSEERAAAVKRFFVENYHIDASRIEIVGKGSNGLLDPSNPDSEVNRRVRIIAIQ